MTSDQPDLFGYNQSPMLIGLWSPSMGSGKSEVASALRQSHGFKNQAMAHSLKAMFAMFLMSCGFDEDKAWDYCYDAKLKEEPLDVLQGKTPRHAMQTLGTEWGRDCIDENLWVRSGLARAKAYLEQGRSVVLDDIRFPNEAQAIEDAGGFMVRVVRPGAEITVPHPSEGSLADWDFAATIINDSSLEVLQRQAGIVVNHFRTINL